MKSIISHPYRRLLKMSKTTMQTILSNLELATENNKMKNVARYHENSVWLSNEFELIMKLIKRNPNETDGEDFSEVDEKVTTATLEPVKPVAAIVNEMNSKKRKSPET